MSDAVFLAQLFNRAIQILVQYANLEDSHRVEIAEFHEQWQAGKSYGTNHYLKYGFNDQGRAVVYRTVRNISSSTTPPDVPTTPQSYVKLG